jgi:threonyl-tRNA synthetase
MQKIPFMLVLGDKEAESGEVTVRRRAGGDIGTMTLDAFIALATQERDEKVAE